MGRSQTRLQRGSQAGKSVVHVGVIGPDRRSRVAGRGIVGIEEGIFFNQVRVGIGDRSVVHRGDVNHDGGRIGNVVYTPAVIQAVSEGVLAVEIQVCLIGEGTIRRQAEACGVGRAGDELDRQVGDRIGVLVVVVVNGFRPIEMAANTRSGGN